MFSFLSRPQSASRPQSSLILYKALFLSLLTLATLSLLAARPAHSQGSWYPVPCDSMGTPLSYPSYNSATGYYALSGTEDWTASYVYPGDVIAAAKAYPDGNSNALSAVSPLDIWANPSTKLGVRAAGSLGGSGGAGNLFSLSGSEGPSRAYAANLPANSYPWWYRVYVGGSYYSGYLNGSAAVDITGHLVYYFKMQWQGGPSPDAQKPPDHLNLLLRTNVTASASVSRDPSAESSDLWARSMATDGSPFGETATAAAGVNAKNEAVTVSGPDHVLGYHLVRAAVDPLTRVAKVAVDGHLTWEASDGVRYGTLEYPTSDKSYPLAKGTNGPTSASASGSIEAAVKPDNRAVTISANVDATKYKKPTLDSSGHQLRNTDGDLVYEAYPHKPDPDGTMKGDVSPGYGDPDYNHDYSYFSVTYKANLLGSWAMKGSQYFWKSSDKNYSSSGVVKAPPPDDDVPLFTNKYRKPYLLYTDATTPPVHSLGDVTDSSSPSRKPDNISFFYKNGDNRGTPLTTGNDGDGAVAAANYYLTIHEPDEIFPSYKHGFLQPGPANEENIIYYDLTPNPRPNTLDQLINVDNGGFITSGFGATATWNFPGAFWDNAAAVLGAVANAPYPARLSYAGLTLAAIGVTVDKIGPKADSRPITLEQAAYDDPMSTFPATHPRGSEPITNYRLYPRVHLWFKRCYTLHDTYDMTGFLGETLEYIDILQSVGSVYGEFQSLADSPHS